MGDLRECKKPEYAEYFEVTPTTKHSSDGRTETEDLMLWTGWLYGPKDTPYDTWKFFIRVSFTDRYPMVPPKVQFDTCILHPNIRESGGEVCLNVLKLPPAGDWSPALSVAKVLLSVSSLLTEPNPNDPLNARAADLMTTKDASVYEDLVAEHCAEHAVKI